MAELCCKIALRWKSLDLTDDTWTALEIDFLGRQENFAPISKIKEENDLLCWCRNYINGKIHIFAILYCIKSPWRFTLFCPVQAGWFLPFHEESTPFLHGGTGYLPSFPFPGVPSQGASRVRVRQQQSSWPEIAPQGHLSYHLDIRIT